jgi:hypothetical protein
MMTCTDAYNYVVIYKSSFGLPLLDDDPPSVLVESVPVVSSVASPVVASSVVSEAVSLSPFGVAVAVAFFLAFGFGVSIGFLRFNNALDVLFDIKSNISNEEVNVKE